MKITRKMLDTAFGRGRTPMEGLREALKDVPDVEPFTFADATDNGVYIHPPCGVVAMDGVRPDMPDAGACDCRNNVPWLRIFVEKRT